MADENKVYHTPDDAEAIFDLFVSCISEWKSRITALRAWSFNFHLLREKMSEHHVNYQATETGAHITYWPKYEDAVVNVYLPDDVEWTAEDIEETSVHELMHVMLSTLLEAYAIFLDEVASGEIFEVLNLLEEQLCTRLACGFMKTKYPEGDGYAR